jgi:hypothetical protein
MSRQPMLRLRTFHAVPERRTFLGEPSRVRRSTADPAAAKRILSARGAEDRVGHAVIDAAG